MKLIKLLNNKQVLVKLLFFLCLLAVAAIYNYGLILFERPQSVHKWRQTDCASIALNYYQNGMDFFEPETHNLTSDGGTSAKCCTSEIPLLYYTVALFYKIFGYHEFIFRLINTMIFFLGLFYLFRFFNSYLSDGFWSIGLTLLFFTAPVLSFYGNSFLSNSSALSFAFIGWYYFSRFVSKPTSKAFIVAILFFSIAGAFKISALFSLFAVVGVLLIEMLGLSLIKKDNKLFDKPLHKLLIVFVAVLPVGLWVAYAAHYNRLHDCTYFSTTIFPIWGLSAEGIKEVLINIREIWIFQYFHRSVFYFLGFCLIVLIVFLRRANKLLNLLLMFLLGEVAFYVATQFWTFKHHDYYVIDIYILPVILVLASFVALKNVAPKVFASIVLKIVFSAFLAFNVYYASEQIRLRYNSPAWNSYSLGNSIYNIEPFLRELGIQPSDKVISLPDEGHVSLYLMNQKGWTDYTDARFNRGGAIRYNQDSAGIAKSIERGAKYLIVRGTKELYLKPYLKPFCTNLLGNFNDVLIFDLEKTDNNYKLPPLEIKAIYQCGAEQLAPDGQQFIGKPDSTLFQNGTTQNSEHVFEGKYSAKLAPNNPYGFTVKLSDVSVGEGFRITVWRKSDKKTSGGIISSSIESGGYYNNQCKIIESQNGWEKLLSEYFIQQPLHQNILAVYLYNPDNEAVWFDNFEIVRYKSIINSNQLP